MDPSSYLGGLVTGEGCFCFAVGQTKAQNTRITPIFALFMSDRETVMYAADLLRGLGLPVHMNERPKAGRGQVGIHINGFKRVGRYCEALMPYLTGQKKQAAQLVLAFIKSREEQPLRAPYTPHELGLVRQLRIVNGNTRGRKNPL